jgi:hypothetical protein
VNKNFKSKKRKETRQEEKQTTRQIKKTKMQGPKFFVVARVVGRDGGMPLVCSRFPNPWLMPRFSFAPGKC